MGLGAVDDFEEEEDRYRGPRGPKYPPIKPPKLTAIDRIAPRHRETLAMLVKKYGAIVIAKAAKTVAPTRHRGRPPRGNRPRFERMHLADFFDELVEEHREAGSRYPKQAAMRDLFDVAYPSRRYDPDAFRRFAATTKRKLPQGRRDLARAKETAKRLNPSKKTRE